AMAFGITCMAATLTKPSLIRPISPRLARWAECTASIAPYNEECAMIDRRNILVGSATALATSLLTPSTTASAQATTVPATKRGFLERPGCRLYYEVTGSGPPIIFAHGLGSNHQTWWQQVPHFA